MKMCSACSCASVFSLQSGYLGWTGVCDMKRCKILVDFVHKNKKTFVNKSSTF